MLRSTVLSLCVVLVACGGAASSGPAPEDATSHDAPADCAALRAEADAARAAHDACLVATPAPEWPQREAFEWLEAQIGARLDGVRHGETVSGTVVDMQQIAERVWALVDEIPEEERDPALLARIEDASEQLMHQHDAEGREQALAEMAGALGVLRERYEPAANAAACEDEGRASAARWMSAQAACEETTLSSQ